MKRVIYIIPIVAAIALGILFTLQGKRDGQNQDPNGRNGSLPKYPDQNGKKPNGHSHDHKHDPAETGTIRFLATDAGRPVQGVEIMMATDMGDGHHEHHTVRTGANGVVALKNIPATDYNMQAFHPLYAPVRRIIRVHKKRTDKVTLELTRGGVISGTVFTRESRPLPGAEISILDPQKKLMPVHPAMITKSGDDGTYSIAGIPLQDVTVYVSHPKYKPYRQDNVMVSTPGQRQQINVFLDMGNVLTGRVISHDGTPIEGAKIGASNEVAKTVDSDKDGNFMIEGLGDKAINLFARARGFGVVYIRGISPNTTGLEIRMYQAGSIEGTVTADAPLGGFSILLFKYDEELRKELLWKTRRYIKTDGKFILPDVEAGTYEISAEAGGYERAPRVRVTIGVAESVTGISLRLQRKSEK